jgi:protein-tyrosine phosphatase
MSDTEPARVLPLEGVRNFRDLGGYATSDGRRVRWRQLFRSASLGSLTARDHATLDALGLRAVFDLRATDERAKEPVRWSTGTGPQLLDHDYLLDLSALSRVLPRVDVDVAAGRGAFAAFYAAMPTRFATPYRALFGTLLRGEAPFVVNCSAGKDRTGVGAALLLAALGVPRNVIIEDYLLSNEHYRPGPGIAAAMSGRHGDWLLSLRPEMLELMLKVDASYLEAAFAAIEREHGSVEGYLAGVLGVDRMARTALRERYTEA